jgi:hypothetical protein
VTVKSETATVYRGGGRRWFTLKAAAKADAVAAIKRKHPSEKGSDHDPGWYWREIPRSDVLLRRVSRLARKTMEVKP